jgi:hypothetical protein
MKIKREADMSAGYLGKEGIFARRPYRQSVPD